MAKLRNSKGSNHHHHHHLQQQQQQQQQQEEECQRSIAADELRTLISRLATATANSFHFLTTNDHLLHPSQTQALASNLSSSALSISSLIRSFPLSMRNPDIITPATKDNDSNWFLRFMASTTSGNDPRWIETLRMSKPSFYLLLKILTPFILFDDPSFPPDHKLAAALLHLAHGTTFELIGRQFRLDSPVRACRAFYEVCKAVVDGIGHLFEFETDVERVTQGFGWMSLSGCRGALGFQRFLFQGNGRLKSSMIVQAVVDTEGRFLDVSAGWSGLMLPSEILPNTKLFTSKVVSGYGETDGSMMPRYLVGDTCCPLLPWLMTPFHDPNTSDSRAFNEAHARAMEVVSQAFRKLMRRWRLLQVTWKEECAEALPFVVVACCLLHNFLFKCSEKFPADAEEVDGKQEQWFAEFEGEEDEHSVAIREDVASKMRSIVGHL